MTAAEAKLESTWRSLPPIIRAKIEKATILGRFATYLCNSLTPEVFEDIDTIVLKLQLLGYKTAYNKVDIENETDVISTETQLIISW